jgi:hypothetical protein
MLLFTWATRQPIRHLDVDEVETYEALLADDKTLTGAVDGAVFGVPGIWVYVPRQYRREKVEGNQA